LADLLPGLTLQEAADHGAHHLERRSRPDISHRPVAGVVLPCSADYLFAWVEQLLRRLRQQWDNSSTLNVYDLRPTAAWLAMDDETRLKHLDAVLAELLAGLGLPSDAAHVLHVQQDVRVLMHLDAVPSNDKQHLLILAERAFRSKVDPRLEVFIEELKDKSTLRRLK